MPNRYYESGELLRAKNRLAAEQFDFAAWVLDRLDLVDRLDVFDAGAGWGRFAALLSTRLARVSTLVCCDVWPGMVADCRDTVRSGASYAAADIRRLPFADDRFDLALAMHMLYELDDVEVAVHELRRVIRPGGVLLASTYSDALPVPLIELHLAALASLGVDVEPEPPSTFTLENGAERLRTAFDDVETATVDQHATLDPDGITEIYRRTGRHQRAGVPRLAERFHELAAERAGEVSTTRWTLFTAR